MHEAAAVGGGGAPRQHLVTRAFVDPALEGAFRAAFVAERLPVSRFVLTLGLGFYAAFGILDYVLVAEGLPTVWTIRFLVGAPLVALALGVTIVDTRGRFMQPAQAVAVAGCGFTVAAMIPHAGQPAADFYWVGVLLVMIFGHVLIPLRAVYATALGIAMVAVWAVAESSTGRPSIEMFGLAFFMIAAEIALAIASYLIEQFHRRDFRRVRDLEQVIEVARASRRARSEFLATMSHELRTPMNGVLGMIDIVGRHPVDADQRRFLDTARRSAEALLEILDDSLDFATLEAGGLRLRNGPLSPHRLASDVMALFAAGAELGAVRLTTVVDEDVPEVLLGDEGRLRQVFTNLVGNAISFAYEGEVELSVSIDTRRGDDVILRVAVRDTGVGIPEDAQSSLFEPFTQVDGSTTRRHGGTGLGLAICQRLVDLMGGDIGVASSPGDGSTFWFTVPLEVSHDPLPVPPSPTRPVATPELQGHRVLVVDDNPVNRLLMLTQLEGEGLMVDVADGGQRALDLADTEAYHAIVLDLHMPGIDGFEVSRRLRARGDRTPIIAVSASADPESRMASLTAGMDAHLAKPVSLDTLMSALAGPGQAMPTQPSSAAPEPSAGVLDEPLIQQLRVLTVEQRDQLLTLFEEGARKHAEAIAAAAARGDVAAVASSAHALKGSSGSVGAAALSSLCADIELGLRTGIDEALHGRVNKLDGAVATAIEALRHALG